ncbi:hypothetical protein JCGZ_19965 [Jatropha curcas]|uniref:Uncharacterized protein n=1 Tax=Jatropha curcas TaxID=180498 RepID=A0A067JTJ2_JATCU|nr:hypothetical protein JCGZ_19965 [Jatropha curcas]
MKPFHFLIVCILFSSLLLIPSPSVARELAHNDENGGKKAEVLLEKESVSEATGGSNVGDAVPTCTRRQSPSYRCKCPVYRPRC